jgi:hypothetical protein
MAASASPACYELGCMFIKKGALCLPSFLHGARRAVMKHTHKQSLQKLHLWAYTENVFEPE